MLFDVKIEFVPPHSSAYLLTAAKRTHRSEDLILPAIIINQHLESGFGIDENELPSTPLHRDKSISTQSSKSLSGNSLIAESLCCPSTTNRPLERSIFISTTLLLPSLIVMESVKATIGLGRTESSCLM